MREFTEKSEMVKVTYSSIDLYSLVELTEDGEDHECATAGTVGLVIAKHAVANGKYFVRLECGHGDGCTCVISREKIRPIEDISHVLWN